jgi:Flp pilus assembly protein TadG
MRPKFLSKKGAAAIEFAVVLPVLILLGIGIAEFGALVYNKHVLANASREGARAGIVQEREDSDGNLLSDDEVRDFIEDIVRTYCSEHLLTFGTDTEPTVNVVGINGAFQEDLSVTVTYQYGFLLPSLFGLGTQTTISARTLMKMERILGGGS